MKFLEKLKILRRPTHTVEILGEPFTFWPVSLPMLLELTTNAEPIMRLVRAIFASGDQGNAGTSTIEETKDPTTGRTIQKITHLGAPDPAVLRARAELEEMSLQKNIQTLVGGENRMLLGRLLADSMRDLEIKGDDQIRAFMDQLDLAVLVEMVKGVMKANAQVFGPLGERVKAEVQKRLNSLAQKNRQDQGDSDSASPEPEVSPPQPPENVNPFGHVGPTRG
jgi:hypothetical protein